MTLRSLDDRNGRILIFINFISNDQNAEAVEKALLFHGRKYPPLLPRVLRVTRAKNIQKTASRTQRPHQRSTGTDGRPSSGGYVAKPSARAQSLTGRATKLLGRAGGASFRRPEAGPRVRGEAGGRGLAEGDVFEGFRARRGAGGGGIAMGGSGKKGGGKPRTRSSKRGAAFRAAGGKKKKTREKK